MILVVDTSVLVEVLINQAGTGPLRRRLFADGQTLCAPALMRLETLDVLRKLARSNRIPETTAHMAFANFVRLPMHYYSEEALVRRIWTLRHNVTAYDAAYVALAETLNATLLTRDQRLASASGTRATIEFVPLTATA